MDRDQLHAEYMAHGGVPLIVNQAEAAVLTEVLGELPVQCIVSGPVPREVITDEP